MKVIERNVQEIGKSLLITLPKGWANSAGIKKGSSVKMMISESGGLSIAPEFIKKEKQEEAFIDFDDNFERKFFREYFGQNDKITIKFGKISEKERKRLYDFLKRFMNVQIIEESASGIVVKSFSIENLSIEECIKRMHLLSLNMIDELLEGNKGAKIEETRNTMSRFYYMLVMQIRRFLTEGKFTDKNQISLIRANDLRMVAEKVQRIGEIVLGLEKPQNSSGVSLLKDAEDYYSGAFDCFTKINFEKALPLWGEGSDLQIRCGKLMETAKKKKDFSEFVFAQEVGRIVRYAKEISLLVR